MWRGMGIQKVREWAACIRLRDGIKVFFLMVKAFKKKDEQDLDLRLDEGIESQKDAGMPRRMPNSLTFPSLCLCLI